jgi:hypothetical protein
MSSLEKMNKENIEINEKENDENNLENDNKNSTSDQKTRKRIFLLTQPKETPKKKSSTTLSKLSINASTKIKSFPS